MNCSRMGERLAKSGCSERSFLADGQVLLPFIAFRDPLEEGEPPPQQPADMGQQHPSSQPLPDQSPAHGEAYLVPQQHGAVLALDEVVVVLEAREPPRDHAVTEEDVGPVVLDEALVDLRQAKLPSLPPHRIAAHDQAGRAPPDGMHLQLAFHDRDAGREQKTAFQRGFDPDFAAQQERVCHAFIVTARYPGAWGGSPLSRSMTPKEHQPGAAWGQNSRLRFNPAIVAGFASIP